MTALQKLYLGLRNSRPSQWVDILIIDEDKLLKEEKQQIIKAYGQGALDRDLGLNVLDTDYYKETYGK